MTIKRKRICVYCGSRSGNLEAYTELAKSFAEQLLKRELDLVYGGGKVGLMGVLSKTVMAGGGQVFGVIPEGLFAKEVADSGITRLEVVGSMHERKARMEELSDGFVALPGGWGTLDEFFEILTWAQIGLHNKPSGLLNFEGFFDPLVAQTEKMIEHGFVAEENRRLLKIGHSPEDILQKLSF